MELTLDRASLTSQLHADLASRIIAGWPHYTLAHAMTDNAAGWPVETPVGLRRARLSTRGLIIAYAQAMPE